MIKINKMVFENNPGLVVGVAVIKGMNNQGIIELDTQKLISEINKNHSLETLQDEPKIDAWRKAYQKFGAKPKEHKSSVENLYKLILSGKSLRPINKVVDIYNYISLKYMLPVGGEDMDKVSGEVELTYADEDEKPILLLGDSELKSPKKGEIIYKDDNGAICRRFNWREADRTKLTEETKNCVLVIEGLPPATKDEIEKAINELAEMVVKYCGGIYEIYVLANKFNSSF